MVTNSVCWARACSRHRFSDVLLISDSAMLLLEAVKNVNEQIAPKLVGMDVTKQKEIDRIMV